MKGSIVLAFALLLCVCAGAALAQTPDLIPPSRETVCDNETGAAYGLCNAYCEAMDCDSSTPAASPTACTKVRTKFQNLAGRDLPCEVGCPCQGIPAFESTLATINYCYENEVAVVVSKDAAIPGYPGVFGELDGAIKPDDPNPVCGYINYFAPQSTVVLPVTPQQAASCIELLHSAAASRGVTCEPVPPI